MNEEIKGKSVRNRGKNFDTREIQLLTELVEKNIEIINSKFSNTVTNEKKKENLGKHHNPNKCSRHSKPDSKRNKN